MQFLSVINILKIILVLFLFYSENKFKNTEFIEKLSYFFFNIEKFKETIPLEEDGSLEIFENKNMTIKIETKSSIIYKSEILYLIIPGGSYKYLSQFEALPVAKKFFSLGYSSAILLYSVYPKCYPLNYNQGLQSIQILSSKFKKIILVGFSAGGHLAGLLGTTQRKKLYNTVGMILCYPVISFVNKVHKGSRYNFFGDKNKNNKKNRKLFSIENRVTPKTLPTYIWTIQNDKTVPYENTLYMIQELKKNNVKYQYKIYEEGRHGMALADDSAIRNGKQDYKNDEVAKWVYLASDFMEEIIKNE